MSDKKEGAPKMVFVKVRDRGTVFHDRSQENGTVAGEAVAEMVETPRVAKALRAGHLTLSDQSEYNSWKKADKAERKEVKKLVDEGDEEALLQHQIDLEEAAKAKAKEDEAEKVKAEAEAKKKGGK